MSFTSAHTLRHEDADRILKQADLMGYMAAGFTDLEIADRDQAHLREFAEAGNAGEMHWFGRHLALRSNPAKVFPGAQGALVLATYYRDRQAEAELARARYPVSRYALGRDYHRLLRKKGQRLLNWIQSEIEPPIQGRVCVDSAPVPEKILARKAGIGWQGKHTNVIHPRAGSYFFLSVILLDCIVPPAPPPTDLCGQCRLCLDACPTQALAEVGDHYEIDAGR
ncbi:MAG: DUF1730 domain-containing protein, partial [Leptospiraceae bacterium]|nr:DUF1730 domain-containing protein [Leptospiraceae bacterium]